jgi:hypothetical protein
MDMLSLRHVTYAVTIDRAQIPSLSSSNSFTYPLFVYSHKNPNLITFLTLILGTRVPQSPFQLWKLISRVYLPKLIDSL